MSMRDIISQMESLVFHCGNMIDKDDPESVWKENVAVLDAAVKKLDGEIGGENAAEVILQIMEKENVNQKELAERMGCVRQNVSQILNRGTINMRYDSFYRMVNALGYEIFLRKK